MKYIMIGLVVATLWLESAIEQNVVGAWASVGLMLIAITGLIGVLWLDWLTREKEHRRRSKVIRACKAKRLDGYIWNLEKEKVRLCGNTERTTLAG